MRAGQRSQSQRRPQPIWRAVCEIRAAGPEVSSLLLDAFDQRLQGDYGFDAVIVPEEVDRTIQQAAEFLQAAERLIAAGD